MSVFSNGPDIFASDAASLAAVASGRMLAGQRAFVTALGNFTLTPTDTQTPDNVKVIAAAGGGNWLQPQATLVGAFVAIDNQAAATVFAGFNAAVWSYKPTSTGLVEIQFFHQYSANLADVGACDVSVFSGGAIAGGTLTNGIRYAVGSIPTRTGGSFVATAIFGFGNAAIANPTLFQAQDGMTAQLQLLVGTTYTISANVGDNLSPGRNWTNQFLNIGMKELAQ